METALNLKNKTSKPGSSGLFSPTAARWPQIQSCPGTPKEQLFLLDGSRSIFQKCCNNLLSVMLPPASISKDPLIKKSEENSRA